MNEPDLLINDVFLPNSHSLFDSLISIINWDERIKFHSDRLKLW